jgi:hypothetical protein
MIYSIHFKKNVTSAVESCGSAIPMSMAVVQKDDDSKKDNDKNLLHRKVQQSTNKIDKGR